MLSDRIIPDELLLSRARFRFIRFVKCKRYLGYNKICKFVLGLFIKLCQLFLGRVIEKQNAPNSEAQTEAAEFSGQPNAPNSEAQTFSNGDLI